MATMVGWLVGWLMGHLETHTAAAAAAHAAVTSPPNGPLRVSCWRCCCARVTHPCPAPLHAPPHSSPNPSPPSTPHSTRHPSSATSPHTPHASHHASLPVPSSGPLTLTARPTHTLDKRPPPPRHTGIPPSTPPPTRTGAPLPTPRPPPPHTHTLTHAPPAGYFDVRDPQDKWVRIHVGEGDVIVVPEGAYHRFSLDDQGFIQVGGAARGLEEGSLWVDSGSRPCCGWRCALRSDTNVNNNQYCHFKILNPGV